MMRRSVLYVLLASWMAGSQLPAVDLQLPLKQKSVRFAVIGDSGTGDKAQFDVGRQMADCRQKFPFESVLMLGDNIYGDESAVDFQRKFEEPYKTLLDAGVKFYASLGNHDNPNERFYKPFNMGEKRYYNFKNNGVEFFALDSTYMDPQQLDWLAKALQASNSAWKICYFHHPLYSDGKFHGPSLDLRARLEPIFGKYGVDVVFSGHEHVYERLKPQHGIYYFVLGSSGQLRPHGVKKASSMMVKGFDQDRTFMLVEIAGDQLYFQTLSRSGKTVDSGVLEQNKVR
jgi:predicted phosphodiesterase